MKTPALIHMAAFAFLELPDSFKCPFTRERTVERKQAFGALLNLSTEIIMCRIALPDVRPMVFTLLRSNRFEQYSVKVGLREVWSARALGDVGI